MRNRRRLSFRLILALLLYAALSALTVRDVGVVGEVAIGWGLPGPPRVVVAWDDEQPVLAGQAAEGLLRAAQVRPVERLQLGKHSLPVAINDYTGGLPDWPARAVHAVTGSLSAVVALHVLLGALLITLVHRFLRFHGTPGAAPTAALVLGCDWMFVFYRKALGGTELLLQAAALLALWAFWSRRWAGGRHGTWAFAVAVGLGLMAKVTFAVTLLALGLAILATRWDRPSLKAPPAPAWAGMAALVALLTAPIWVTLLHHQLLPATLPAPLSHDQLSLQLDRAVQGVAALLSGGAAPARESASTWWWFMADPLGWLSAAYGGSSGGAHTALRLVGWGLVAGGSAIEWAQRSNSPRGALLRFMSLFVPLQVFGLWLANRDLHHMAQATPMVAIWFGLAVDRLAAVRAGAMNLRRPLWGVALAAPWMLAGVLNLWHTDPQLRLTTVPHFRSSGQLELAELLQRNQVRRLVATDYDLYGMLELRAPQVQTTHGWGDLSVRLQDREGALTDLLRFGAGGHYLVVRPSAPMIYNLRPDARTLLAASEAAGVEPELLDSLTDDSGEWAWLYALR